MKSDLAIKTSRLERNTHVCRNVGALLCLEVLFRAEYVILIIIEIIWQKAEDMKTEIESEQTKIQLEIPESYELSENEDGDRTYACFERPGSSDMVFSFLLEADEEDFQDAEDYIRREFADDCAENKCKTKICEQAYLQGRMYYYYIVSFKDMHARFQKLVAACDIRPGEIYTVDTDWVDKKEVLTINAVSLFLDIAVSEKE